MPPPALERLRRELVAAGLPRRYVARLLGELQDHLHAGAEGARAAGATEAEAKERAQQELGDLDRVLEAVAERPALQAFVRRHPLLVFTLTPLLVLLHGALALCAIATFTPLSPGYGPNPTPASFGDAVLLVYATIAYGTTPALAAAMFVVAARRGLPLYYVAISGGLLMLAGAIKTDLVLCLVSGSAFHYCRWGADLWRLLGPPAALAMCLLLRTCLRARRAASLV